MKMKKVGVNTAIMVLAVGLAVFFIREVTMKMPSAAYKGDAFSFQYPEGWTLRESSGTKEKYFQVHVFGRVQEEVGFGPSVALTVYPKKAGGGAHDTAAALAADRLKRVRALSGFELEYEGPAQMPCGVTARRTDMVYIHRLPLYSTDAKDVVIKDRSLIFERGGELYILNYKNIVSDYTADLPAFDLIVRTLRFAGG